MSAVIYIEGGGNSKDLHSRCREAFRRLLQSAGFDRKPKLVACGGRDTAFKDFCRANKNPRHDFIALWVDSEDLMEDIEKTWEHLRKRDNWTPPDGVTNEQVLMMTTCMETWIIADRKTLKEHFKKGKESFIVFGKLDPAALEKLPSFQRCIRILKTQLN